MYHNRRNVQHDTQRQPYTRVYVAEQKKKEKAFIGQFENKNCSRRMQ